MYEVEIFWWKFIWMLISKYGKEIVFFFFFLAVEKMKEN